LLDGLRVRERRVAQPELSHRRAELMEHVRVEPGPDLARILEPAVAVVAQEQRAELDTRAARFGIAADHELLPMLALELEPVLRARGHVRALGPLGNQPLPALAAGLLEQGLAVAVAVLGPA